VAAGGAPRGELRQFWRTFSRNQLAMVGGAVVTVLVLMAVLAPLLAPWDPNRPDTKKILTPPSSKHWLGTDPLGRDVLSRVLYGARVSLSVGFVSVGIAALIGVLLGTAAGYHGGMVDNVIMRLVDLMLVFPRFFLLLAVLAFLKPSIWTIMTVIGLTGWMGVARLVRAEFLRGRNFEYVQAARALGVSNKVIMFRHLLPNAMVATMTFLPFILSGSVMTLTALDFLGFGLPPGSASLGELLKQGKANIQAPWLGISGFFTVAIMLSLLIFMGEAVRDAFDPRKTFQ